jgi:hypothetical protein
VLKARAGDWRWWREPKFNGVTEPGQGAPVELGEAKNVVWKASMPGRAHSSPTVVGSRVFDRRW